MTVSSIVFGTKNKPEEKPKSPQRSFIAADGFEFTTELVSYIPAKAVSSSAVHFHTFPPAAYVKSDRLHIEGFTHLSQSHKIGNIQTLCRLRSFSAALFVFPILPHWKLAFLVGVPRGGIPL